MNEYYIVNVFSIKTLKIAQGRWRAILNYRCKQTHEEFTVIHDDSTKSEAQVGVVAKAYGEIIQKIEVRLCHV